MLMLREHSGVVDSVTKSLDLLSNISFRLEEFLQGSGNTIRSEVSVLDGTWVTIMVNQSPFSFISFDDLVRLIT